MLSDIVKNEVVKKTKLVHKLNPFQTTDTSYLLKKDNGKYITKQEFNSLTKANFAAELKQANLASKKDVADFDEKLRKLMRKLL